MTVDNLGMTVDSSVIARTATQITFEQKKIQIYVHLCYTD